MTDKTLDIKAALKRIDEAWPTALPVVGKPALAQELLAAFERGRAAGAASERERQKAEAVFKSLPDLTAPALAVPVLPIDPEAELAGAVFAEPDAMDARHAEAVTAMKRNVDELLGPDEPQPTSGPGRSEELLAEMDRDTEAAATYARGNWINYTSETPAKFIRQIEISFALLAEVRRLRDKNEYLQQVNEEVWNKHYDNAPGMSEGQISVMEKRAADWNEDPNHCRNDVEALADEVRRLRAEIDDDERLLRVRASVLEIFYSKTNDALKTAGVGENSPWPYMNVRRLAEERDAARADLKTTQSLLEDELSKGDASIRALEKLAEERDAAHADLAQAVELLHESTKEENWQPADYYDRLTAFLARMKEHGL